MIPRRLTSLLAVLCLLMAAAVSLTQPVVVAGTHLHQDAALVSAILDDEHAHESDLPEHDTADHTHDVAYDTHPKAVPSLKWPDSWTWERTPRRLPATPSGYDRPPRQSHLA